MDIVGHQKIQKFLDKSMEKNAVAHAYIFSGPENLGKFSLALEFAKKLTGSDEKINPDVIIIKPDIKENKGVLKEEYIKIEKIRDLQHQLSVTSYFGKCKVGIIDNADRMNKSSQNSLLKTLEEPADNIVLILIVRDLNKILPTIRSRCTQKKFSLVSEEELSKIFPKDVKNKDEIIFWSLGRPGLAMNLLENKNEFSRRQEVERELQKIISANISDKMAFAEKAGKNSPELLEKLNWWIVYFRENMFGRKTAIPFSQDRMLKVIEGIEKSIETIHGTNSNVRLILENLLLDF
jgi:DNA polymerase III subunit delta'